MVSQKQKNTIPDVVTYQQGPHQTGASPKGGPT